jgi:hypothetical protein
VKEDASETLSAPQAGARRSHLRRKIMKRNRERRRSGRAEIATDVDGRSRGGGGAMSRASVAWNKPICPSGWRLVGGELGSPRATPVLGRWGRSISRMESRRMEHLARVLGIVSADRGADPPPAA